MRLVDFAVYEVVEIHEEDESVFEIFAIPVSQSKLRDGPKSLHREHSEVINHVFHHIQLRVDYSVIKPVKLSIVLSHIVRFII
jgi:hypothetical protein